MTTLSVFSDGVLLPPSEPVYPRRTPKKPHKPERPSHAEYEFLRALAENVAHLRQVQDTARARQAAATQLAFTFEGAA